MKGQEHLASVAWSEFCSHGKPSLRSLQGVFQAMCIPWVPISGLYLEKGVERLLFLGLIEETQGLYAIRGSSRIRPKIAHIF